MDGMVSTILAMHPNLPPYAFALMVVLAPVLGWWLAARQSVAEALTVVSLAVVALLTLTPGGSNGSGCLIQWPALSLHTFTAPEPAANVIMFILPVFFAGIATKHPFWMAVVGSVLSAQIELVQGAVPALGRACDMGDWQANTIGSVVGAGLALMALEFHRNRPLVRETAVVGRAEWSARR
jgi:glycopeptide antibiotics resistance protein